MVITALDRIETEAPWSYVMHWCTVWRGRVLEPQTRMSWCTTWGSTKYSSGTQLAERVLTELTLPIRRMFLWLHSNGWSQSNTATRSMRAHVARIQTLTEVADWRYLESMNNPSDNLTQGFVSCGSGAPSSVDGRWQLLPPAPRPSQPCLQLRRLNSESQPSLV